MNRDIEWLLKEKYNGEKSDAFFADCKRLALGEPLAFLIGHVPFLNCTIYLDTRPHIPRSETEFWTAKVIAEIQQFQSSKQSLGLTEAEPVKIMDMCAGSGCIGTAIAKATGNTLIDFAELELKQLDTIQKNIVSNDIEERRVVVKQSNLFSAFPGKKYHFIVCNPPYIDAELHRVDESVRDFEPHLALFGGHKGLEIIIQLITEAKYHLEPDGQLWIEHEPEQSNEVSVIAEAHGLSTTTHNDQYGVNRFSVLMLQ